MAVCDECNQEMMGAGVSCVMGDTYRIRYLPCIGCAPIIGGGEVARLGNKVSGLVVQANSWRLGAQVEPAHNCHDCNTPPGGFHHPGCDDERCPHGHVTTNGYGEQAISCGQCSREN